MTQTVSRRFPPLRKRAYLAVNPAGACVVMVLHTSLEYGDSIPLATAVTTQQLGFSVDDGGVRVFDDRSGTFEYLRVRSAAGVSPIDVIA
jgi:hypothetical protein